MLEGNIQEMAISSMKMFAFLAVELTVLFLLISYLVGWLQIWISPERVQSILGSRNGRGYVIAALLGAITPFCSCSTIPFLKGLMRARAGFGPMTVFLFSSPLLNPIVIGLLVVTFGWKVALFYFAVAMGVSVGAGYILERLGFERYIKADAIAQSEPSCCGGSQKVAEPQVMAEKVSCCGGEVKEEPAPVSTGCCSSKTATKSTDCCVSVEAETVAVPPRWLMVWRNAWGDFKQALPYMLVGVFFGSMIYGFMPTALLTSIAGDGSFWSIPIAAVIGIPLYIRATAVIPISQGLVAKGMAMGSVMALIIGSAGASLAEVILLKSLFKTQMIIAFLIVVLTMAIGAGALYQVIFA